VPSIRILGAKQAKVLSKPFHLRELVSRSGKMLRVTLSLVHTNSAIAEFECLAPRSGKPISDGGPGGFFPRHGFAS